MLWEYVRYHFLFGNLSQKYLRGRIAHKLSSWWDNSQVVNVDIPAIMSATVWREKVLTGIVFGNLRGKKSSFVRRGYAHSC